MLLLLLLLGDKKAKVQFEIELISNQKDGNFDFQELTEFLHQLNYVHNRAIRNSLLSTLIKYNILGVSWNNEINEDSFYSKFMRLMDDVKFRKAYNSFCKTGITITDFYRLQNTSVRMELRTIF